MLSWLLLIKHMVIMFGKNSNIIMLYIYSYVCSFSNIESYIGFISYIISDKLYKKLFDTKLNEKDLMLYYSFLGL